MSLQSAHFLLFLTALVAGMQWLGARSQARKNLLLLASLYFYACWDWRFVALLLLLAAANYAAARRIEQAVGPARRRWLVAALALSLTVLGGFKYAGFFVDGAVLLLRSLGLEPALPVLSIALPVGISFFTFQGLSYVLDVYRGQQRACTDPRDFLLFTVFFPTLLSGPITRAHILLPQLQQMPRTTPEQFETGFALLLRGLFKKIALADVLALHWVDPAFDKPAALSPLFLGLALVAFTLQLYADLSGYTDIARGSARLLGLELPQNFLRPYRSASITEFWQRWHITMSSFFRDYVFFALGGSRGRPARVSLNLMVTFIAIGLWHGAGLRFVLYGAIHGGFVCAERAWRLRRERLGRPPPPRHGARWLWAVGFTLTVVILSRVLFRASDLAAAAHYLQAMLRLPADITALNTPVTGLGLAVLLLASALHALPTHWQSALAGRLRRQRVSVLGLATALLGALLVALSPVSTPFLYFKF